MKERPISFSSPMVRALLNGTKTQTRRVVKPVRGFEWNNVCRPDMAADAHAVWWHGEFERVGCLQKCPYGVPGDRLWVRETCFVAPKRFGEDLDTTHTDGDGDGRIVQYLATQPCTDAARDYGLKATPSIFMPRWASRITLEITDVRVQRVQEISEKDAKAEGARRICDICGNSDAAKAHWVCEADYEPVVSRRGGLRRVWDELNEKRGFGWDVNPWVWAITFSRIEEVR